MPHVIKLLADSFSVQNATSMLTKPKVEFPLKLSHISIELKYILYKCKAFTGNVSDVMLMSLRLCRW